MTASRSRSGRGYEPFQVSSPSEWWAWVRGRAQGFAAGTPTAGPATSPVAARAASEVKAAAPARSRGRRSAPPGGC